MRDTIKMMLARAKKVPAIAEYLARVEQDFSVLTKDEIDKLDIKRSDKKLLANGASRYRAQTAASLFASQMPTSQDVPVVHTLYRYKGFGTEYSGLEIRPGDILTFEDGFLRIDFLRLSLKEPTDHIMQDCVLIGTTTQNEANDFIGSDINGR